VKRTFIVGGPGTGKTTMAKTMSSPRHADELIRGKSWTEQSEYIAHNLGDTGTLEGAAVVRGLRKWLAQNPSQRLDETEVIHLSQAHIPLTAGQERMAKGIETVWNEIRPELHRRGATIREGA